MNHLTIDEIIRFVSFDTLDNENLILAGKVNSHILTCAECRDKVREYQKMYDESLLSDSTEDVLIWQSSSDEDDGLAAGSGLDR